MMATPSGFAELGAATHFSFLEGASSPAAMVETALAGWTEHWQVAFGPFVLLVALFAPRGIWGLVRGRDKP